MNQLRVISLLPAATEIVCALGMGNCLVGRSHECDFPPVVRRLPVCTEARLDALASSAEIDRQVKALLEEALSIYRIDAEQIRRLRPDLILTQVQCDVCAVSLPEVEQALADWLVPRPRILSLSTARLDDLWSEVVRVAEALDATGRCGVLVTQLKERIADINSRSGRIKRQPSVACIEWIEPLMAAGNWVPELVELAGGLNLFGEADKHSPWLNWEAVQEHDPDVIVVMPCGFDLARTRRGLPGLTRRPDWSKLRAVRSGRIFLTDGNQYFSRPGPRLVESLEILAELIHPDVFQFGHEGTGWQRG